MLKKIVTLFCLSFSITLIAQVGGESAYQFLNLVASPRQAALGGKIFTNVDYDVTQGILNPATVNEKMDNQLAVNYNSYLGAIGYGTAAYARGFGENNRMFHFGATFRNFGTFEGRDEDGNTTGDFNAGEMAFSVSHSLRLNTTNFYFGTSGKIISSSLEQYHSLGAAIDLSMMYFNPESTFNASLVVRNFGLQLSTYQDVQQNLPLDIALGLSKRLEHVPIRWHLTLDNLHKWPIASPSSANDIIGLEGERTEEKVGFLAQVIRRTSVGAELFPEKGFNLRLGYNFRRGNELAIDELRAFSGLSFGFALKMKKMRFSYTYAKYSSAANSSFFGLQIDLN